MATAIFSYFHSAALEQRYLRVLDDALQTHCLQAEERLWLQSLTDSIPTDRPDPVRVDRILFNTASARADELAAALLFSHALTDNPRTYLYSLANGIEVFNDRHALLSALRDRYAEGDAEAIFECEKIDDSPFRAQMLAIVDQQVENLGQMAAQLKLMPTLLDASTASLTRQLRELLPHMVINPETHLLQLVPDANNDAQLTPFTRTLAMSAFDDSCKVQFGNGFMRRYLDAQGRIANAADSALFSRAFAGAAARMGEHYTQLLSAFWTQPVVGSSTRRDLAVGTLKDSLRRQLYRCRHEQALSADTLQALSALVQSPAGALPAGSHLRCHRMTVSTGNGKSYALAGTFVVRPRDDAAEAFLWFSTDHQWVRFQDLEALAAFFATVPGREQLRPALALEDQSDLFSAVSLQVGLEEIPGPVGVDRVDSIIALQTRNLMYALQLSAAPEQITAMIDDALDIRQLLDPRQLQINAGRWRRDAPFSFTEVWIKPERSTGGDPRPPARAGQSLPIRRGESNADAAGTRAAVPQSPSQPMSPPAPDTDQINDDPDASWVQYAQAFDSRAERLRQVDNFLHDTAAQALQHYVCAWIEEGVRAEDIRVQWLESAPVDLSDVEAHAVPISESQQLMSIGLVALLLECVSGHRAAILSVGAQLIVDRAPAQVHMDLINHALGKLVPGFIERYLQRFKASRIEFLRQGDEQLQPSRDALSLREDAMRLDLVLGARQGRFDATASEMAQQILEQPERAWRTALGGVVTEAFSISLKHGDHCAALLSNMIALTQPLEPGSPVLLWCCEFGWRQYASVQRLKTVLHRNLNGVHRERWLALLGARDRSWVRAHLSKISDNQVIFELDRVDGHFTEAMQQAVLSRKQQDLEVLCQRAVRSRFEADLFTRLAAASEPDAQLTDMLDGLSVRIDNSIFEAMLPSWINSATLSDLKLYYGIFNRYYLATDGGKDFMFGIPTLQDLALEQLRTRLNQDFPGQPWNPESITVTSRRFVSAFPAAGDLPSAVPAATQVRSESLTDFAINRFVDTQDAALSVASNDQPQAAWLLTPDYVRQLVRRLDVGTQYMALLRKAFTPGDAHYATRKRLFIDQLPPALLGVALPEKVLGKLSAQAYDFIARVLDMPDGIAREPVDGIRVILSPLQLVADAGMSSDTVNGVYLICPAAPNAGPVVLYAIYHAPFTLREYPDQSALLDDIRTEESLQALLLERVEPEVRRRYAHGGFVEPHLPFSTGLYDFPLRKPGPLSLEITEVRGNALRFLYHDSIKVLLDIGMSNSVSNQQADQAGRTFLASLVFSQALNLLPSKLAALVTLWQSHTLLRASAVSVSGHRWGEALSEFTAAMGVMVTAREQAIDDKPAESHGRPGPEIAQLEQEEPLPNFSWRGTSLTAEQQMRLQGLQAQGVALTDLRHDELFNLYMDKHDDTPYAVVAGRVYQVKRIAEQGKWIIVGADGTPGPQLVLDGNQRWQLDISMRLRGGGPVISSLRTSSATSSAEDVLIIEASGMPEIRLLYRDRARRIAQAHQQARLYLENCLENLNACQRGTPQDPRITNIIGDFFGADQPGQQLLTQVESATKALLDAVMDSSLSPFSSPRFVVGSNRQGRERVTAFIVPDDPQKRLFLTEQFFRTPLFRLKPEAAAAGFDSSVHFQATTLIHELSHIVLDTKDMAYLESNAPYPDLLRQNTASNLSIRAEIERLHDYRFSHRTLKRDLFKHFEEGQWRDITRDDALGYSTILRITGSKTLDDARTVFLTDVNKRSQIMLRNADSLTLLVVRLGRHNYVVPSP
ncbi:dermonecrotic toxin domain-containing protein [Pseudomonas sp. LP_7_YM]|uniref:dermonecrotic toxin domain-containing protein n=1 Tax=Pseudomonas sp. LP_7_YM TaxID=2485137 RepID=UPI0010622D2F|nr:DUF6543 domain-containing protein [Pseudomonas sp. LP_7_YM]TDV63406.1 hypothetical protein EC915_106173 [Pseudomonas sp. LP_7_YM]